MIGIIGNGFVGNAVYQNLRDKVECKVYDVDKNRSPNTLDEVLKQNFIFVCLPTPMKENGECDLSILDQFFENIFWDNPDIEGTFVIKSTVPIGTTRRYSEKYNVIHNPEFLTARNAVEDFRRLIGSTNPEEAEEGTIRKIYAESISANAIHGSDSDENGMIESELKRGQRLKKMII